jgi:hypothetical protein
MTNEERDLITKFIERVGGARPSGFAAAAGTPGGAPPLPPVDPEADALIAELLARNPEARYRLTQTAFVQEQALVQAQNRIQRLEWELQQARQQAQGAQPASPWGSAPQGQQGAQQGGRGFLGGLFGGGSRQPPQPQYPPQQYAPPPQPQYPPGYNPGMLQQQQRGGSGFLGGALATAAGVAGGMVAGNALMGLFSGGHGGVGNLASAPGDLAGAASAANPWGGDAAASDPFAAGGADKSVADNSGWGNVEQGGWQQPASDQASWDDQQTIDTAGDSGWSDGGGGGDDWS